jgi:hypothetical protein
VTDALDDDFHLVSPNGLRWRHVHETWMAPEGDAPDEAAS